MSTQNVLYKACSSIKHFGSVSTLLQYEPIHSSSFYMVLDKHGRKIVIANSFLVVKSIFDSLEYLPYI